MVSVCCLFSFIYYFIQLMATKNDALSQYQQLIKSLDMRHKMSSSLKSMVSNQIRQYFDQYAPEVFFPQ